MKIRKLQLDKRILSLDNDDYAILSSFKDGISVYTFTYSINTSEAIKKNATIVRIRALPINRPKPSSIFSSNSITKKPDTILLAKNIQQMSAIKKDIKNNNNNSAIMQGMSDITTNIPNNNPLSSNIGKIYRFATSRTIDQQSSLEPIIQQIRFKKINNQKSYKNLSIKSILKDKIDPIKLEISKLIIGTKKSFGGISTFSTNFGDKTTSFIEKSIEPFNAMTSKDVFGSTIIPIVDNGTTSFRKISKNISFGPGSLDNNGSFVISFELIGENNIIIEKVAKIVDHGQNLKIIQTPKIPPIVDVVSSACKNILTIKQADKNAIGIKIFRKNIKKHIKIEESEYSFVSDIELQGERTIFFEDLTNNASDIIYRIIPYGNQQLIGSCYASIIAPAHKFRIYKGEKNSKMVHCGLYTQIDSFGIKVNVFNLPSDVISISVLARNKSKFEKTFRRVPSLNSNQLCVATNDANGSYIFSDNQVKPYCIYEYKCLLYYDNGDEEMSSQSEIIEYIPYTSGIVDTQIKNIEIVENDVNIDIQFDIVSNITNSKNEIIKLLLESQNHHELFSDEIYNERDTLNKLLAHSIKRIDLSNGEISYFPVVVGNRFSDLENRVTSIASPIKSGRTYKYIISALLRTPETLFENTEREYTNNAGISVSYLPFKFKHPIVSRFGSTVSPSSIAKNHGMRAMEFGDVGNYTSVDVNINIIKPKIFDIKVRKFNKNINVVNWNVNGEKSMIDHFLVVVNRMGAEEIIGAVHTYYNSNLIEFYDENLDIEPGSFRYKIIPIYNDYTQGVAIESQEVI